MKLTAILLTVAILHLSARGFSQTINYSGKEVSLKTVFAVIKKQTGYTVFYDQKVLENAKPVTVKAQNVSLEEFLSSVLDGQALDFTIEQTAIVITKKIASVSEAPVKVQALPIPPLEISGRITNKEGEPLVGASIIIKKKSGGVVSDSKGMFLLRNVEPGDEVTVSFTGYVSQTLKFNNEKSLSIVLQRSESPLDEVQVTAYGSTTQRYTTSNIATVSSKQIEMQPVTNPLLALQGQVAGLVIQQQTGFSNGGIAVDIRGQGSIAAGSAPLYVVDGVPYFGQMLPGIFYDLGYSGSGSSSFGAQLGNTLAFINPSDIESISILKDADATSIYGSRASGGAILITTKKGKSGPVRVTAQISQGWQKESRFNKLLNSRQYLEMRHEAMINSGTSPSDEDYDLNGAWDTTKNTDWQKVLLGGTGHWLDDNLNISGGNDNTQYYFSGTYHNESPAFINPTNLTDQKASGYLSVNSTSSNGRFSAHASIAYQYDNNKLPAQDLTGVAMQTPPVAPALFNSDGSLNWQIVNGVITANNPIAYDLADNYDFKTYNLISNARMGYKILPELELATDAGYTFMQNNQFNGFGIDVFPAVYQQYYQRSSIFNDGSQVGWNVEPQLNYKKVWRENHLEVLAGSSFMQSQSSQMGLNASGFISDELLQDPRAASTIRYRGTTASLYRYNAFFSRVNYRWKDNYIVDLSARHDGSSRFGSNNKFHTFGSAAASWIFSSEKFLKNSKIVSFGKLTGSYGTVGNDQIGDYQYLDLYGAGSFGTSPYQGVTGISVGAVPNPFLQWEVQRKLEARLDLGFAKDRILLSLNYYRDRSSNQLLNYNLPSFTGSGGYETNFPALIQNSGSEIVIQTQNIRSRSFSWSSKFNITFRGNKLLSFPGLATSSYSTQLEVGQPFTIKRVYRSAGIDPQTGLYQFYSAEGKIIPNSQLKYPGDAIFINTQPTYFGGLSNTLRYKGFELDFLLQFSVQRVQNGSAISSYPGNGMNNEPTFVLNRWRKPGDRASVQEFEARPTNDQYSAFYNYYGSSDTYDKAYYVRLKNVSLQWQVPSAWSSKIKVRECYLFSHAQNLLTVSNFKGTNPEAGAYSLPPLMVIDAGIKVTF